MPSELTAVQDRLGYRFKEPALLERALTHRSWAYESGSPEVRHYERLEFLGDALLGFLVAECLWRGDPGADEGILTRRKQVVVRTSTLARAAHELGLGEALRLGRGERSTGGQRKVSLLADVFEAVLASVFLDGGVRAARSFVRRHLRGPLAGAGRVEQVGEDYKTRLQELTQARSRATPQYRIVAHSGPDHERTFEVEVRLGRRRLARGSGSSRKRAEQAAARIALAKLAGDESR